MDVFEVHGRLIKDYQSFTTGFVKIEDAAIREHAERRIQDGEQWPEPYLALNPQFASGGTVEELAASGVLHPRCAPIFRGPDGSPIHLHRHQREAIEAARDGGSYVLTTGTGSGKSLGYIIPIVDHVLRLHAHGEYRPGVKAIVVYPMNALANSQVYELGKFLGADRPVSFDRYTGQDDEEERRRIRQDPPDILLTNYVMLELLLTRPTERRALIDPASDLRFLVLDELHTYRGRQGSDVAMLVRRLKDACGSAHLQCVGTSATMTTHGTREERRRTVAEVATRLFGEPVDADHVIDETLQRATAGSAVDDSALAAAVETPSRPIDHDAFVADPLVAWVEESFGLVPDPDSGMLIRPPKPGTLSEAAAELARRTGKAPEACEAAIRSVLVAGSKVDDPRTGRPVFAFRLHQFLSKGDQVYVTLEPPGERHVTSKYQTVAPGESGGRQRILVPVAFCRECGQDYLKVVAGPEDDGRVRFGARLGLDVERKFKLSPDDIMAMNPNTLTCPVFASPRHAKIVASIYRRIPVLWNENDEVNPWGVRFLRMLDIANDSGIFRATHELESHGWTLDGNVFVRGADRMLPLYEAKMIHHFDPRFSTYEGATREQLNKGTLPRLTPGQHADPKKLPLPRYWVSENEVAERLARRAWENDWLFGWRDICRSADERTIICSAIPRVAIGHTFPLMCGIERRPDPLVANLSSFVLDYVCLQKLAGTHVTYGVVNQLPVLPPDTYEEPVPWLGEPTADWIRGRVLELSYTAYDMTAFARDLGDDGPPFVWDEERRFAMRAELDAAYFHLYGVARDDVDYILDSFRAFQNNDADRFTRTKKTIGEIYDAIADAARIGVPYRTILDPPPGHGPRHPVRAREAAV